MPRKFNDWIDDLRENVVEGEYGYEPGEFTVYPEHWRSMFREGLTPSQAFRRALDGFAEARKQEDAERLANWRRIQAEDAALLAANTPRLTTP